MDERTLETAPRDDIQGALALVICSAAGVATRPTPPQGALVIGRGQDCDIVVEDVSVSRRHVAVHAGNPPILEDLGSTNGARIGDVQLRRGQRHPLAVGMVIEIGSATIFVQRATPALLATAMGDEPSTQRMPRIPLAIEGAALKDATMARLYRLADVVAPSAMPVLILGETGVGKEVFAEYVHTRSPRATRQMLRLNCAAIPEALLEGELFGYEKGAFTGANQSKLGLFESADRGTVLLDEVGDLPLGTQAKLLRVLESGEVLRLGSLRPHHVDVRFLGATNRDLQKRVAEGAFRADLFFRLNAVTITIPPLRERPQDIEQLARYFVEQAARRMRHAIPILTDDALAALRAHSWPGNIRELRNVIERAALLCMDDRIEAEHIGLSNASLLTTPATSEEGGKPTPPPPSSGVSPPSSAGPLRADLQTMERQRIVDALERCAGNQSRAAEMLGMPRRTFLAKLDAYAIARPRKRK
jgi:transcriptional regulator with GAF, ATPase, and Fis domain